MGSNAFRLPGDDICALQTQKARYAVASEL